MQIKTNEAYLNLLLSIFIFSSFCTHTRIGSANMYSIFYYYLKFIRSSSIINYKVFFLHIHVENSIINKEKIIEMRVIMIIYKKLIMEGR
jgi:hypothetical protein